MIETIKYVRKSFPVDAIDVTESNMEEIAEWCGGEIEVVEENNRVIRYIYIDVHNPMTERQTKAFVGDWVLYAGTGFKVYPEKAFKKSFEMVPIKQKVTMSSRKEE